MVTGTPLAAIAEAWRHVDARTPRNGRVRGIDITERIFGDARDGRVTGVALRLPLARRVRLSGGSHRLADVVAASSSPWGLAHGHLVDGRPLYDAGTVSNTAADLAPGADTLLVLAPLARGVLGWQGRIWEQRLVREVALWRLRHRGGVRIVRPTAEVVSAGGGGWSQIMDMRSAPAVYAAARRQGRSVAQAWGVRRLQAA